MIKVTDTSHQSLSCLLTFFFGVSFNVEVKKNFF